MDGEMMIGDQAVTLIHSIVVTARMNKPARRRIYRLADVLWCLNHDRQDQAEKILREIQGEMMMEESQ